jgi:hypothetical protein
MPGLGMHGSVPRRVLSWDGIKRQAHFEPWKKSNCWRSSASAALLFAIRAPLGGDLIHELDVMNMLKILETQAWMAWRRLWTLGRFCLLWLLWEW